MNRWMTKRDMNGLSQIEFMWKGRRRKKVLSNIQAHFDAAHTVVLRFLTITTCYFGNSGENERNHYADVQ